MACAEGLCRPVCPRSRGLRSAAHRMCGWKRSNTICRKTAFPEPGTTSLLICRRRMAPVLHPGTHKPIGPDDLAPLFPMSLMMQEVSTEREIEIPGEVRQVYAQWRPSPLFRARGWRRRWIRRRRFTTSTRAVSPAGSHKPNTAVPQAYYNKKDGTKRLSTETGAGQWGSSLAMACAFFGLECKVYMVRVSYDQKPYRRALMEAFGASVTASPSNETESGRAILAEHPDSRGSLGIAISEAVEMAAKDPHTKYALGSVLNHVLLHQTVIGLETHGADGDGWRGAGRDCRLHRGRIELCGTGDAVPGTQAEGQEQCARGGGGAGGLSEPDQGAVCLRFGDTGHLTPLVKMHTLGSTFIPPGIHAGGLRYHGMAPLVSHLLDLGLIEASSVQQLERLRRGSVCAGGRDHSGPGGEPRGCRGDSRSFEGEGRGHVAGRFCSICAGMGISTCSRTSITRRASCRTTTIPRKRSRWPVAGFAFVCVGLPLHWERMRTAVVF